MSKANTEETKTYLVKRNGEDLKITVPAKWKVTYAPVQPGDRHSGNCLRFYESDKQQRAIFTDVKSFMDLSIGVEKLVTKTLKIDEVEQSKWDNYERRGETLIEESWVALQA